MGDQYTYMQPFLRPNVDGTLIGERLDVCCSYEIDGGGSELRWCQGEVIKVSDGTNIVKPNSCTACFKRGEAVVMRWDANDERNEPSSESAQRLLPSKWNPKEHTDGSWRFDLDISE